MPKIEGKKYAYNDAGFKEIKKDVKAGTINGGQAKRAIARGMAKRGGTPIGTNKAGKPMGPKRIQRSVARARSKRA